MYTIYLYDKNWISVGIINPIASHELTDTLERLEANGFNVNAVKNQED